MAKLNLTEYGKLARREYNRAWEKKNQDKRKAIKENYWNRKGEELRLKELEEKKRGAENEL